MVVILSFLLVSVGNCNHSKESGRCNLYKR